MSKPDLLEHATAFVETHGRLLERRLLAYWFQNGPRDDVVEALRAYQNEDGGFGHALEPDVRASASQAIHVDFALTRLVEIGAVEPKLAVRACEFLAVLADAEARVPAVGASALAAAHAKHWDNPFGLEPSIERTLGLAGLLHAQGVKHTWLDAATDACWKRLEEPVREAHLLLGAAFFLEHVPDRARAEALVPELREWIPVSEMFLLAAPVTQYGVTPLHFAPTPTSFCRSFFDDAIIEGHLDDLERRQQEDGGWPIDWEPPGPASLSEWRGRWTLEALGALRAYGRIA